jgi:hypothetical protein
MDRFVGVTGLIGLILFVIAVVILIHSIVKTVKRKRRITRFIYSLLASFVIFAIASSFIYLSLFLQTFSRYTHEEKIGWVYAEAVNDSTRVTFFQENTNRMHFFTLAGDQWMIDGYFLRWSTALRWLGADAYYRITRFSGRWEQAEARLTSIHQLHPEERLWKFLLKHAEKIPGVDTAYGIAAFQYPSTDTFYVYINDTGFILRKD